ncbi:MAG TPA: Bax inhibitor-1/YccA family protein [Aeromonadales bacterium]|nr:Bax inhibitor-1/YccA family protein [Aeromonadales bacterium]
MDYNSAAVKTGTQTVEINKVLKNTYSLLAMTLIFSAFTAWYAATNFVQPMGLVVTLIGVYGLMFAVYKTANSIWGLFFVFAFTGFLGYSLGPLLAMVSATAPDILFTALGGTGLIFFALSGYVLVTRKDMSFLSGMLTAGMVVLVIAMIAGFFLHLQALQLAISAGFMLFSSALILYQTSEIIHGGETNYIRATVTLFVSLYNIFVSLLNLLMSFSGND